MGQGVLFDRNGLVQRDKCGCSGERKDQRTEEGRGHGLRSTGEDWPPSGVWTPHASAQRGSPWAGPGVRGGVFGGESTGQVSGRGESRSSAGGKVRR